MTFSGARAGVTVLPWLLPFAPVPDLETIGKPVLTCGGRYWVRTSDLFGVKNVRAIFSAGQTLNRLLRGGQGRTLADGSGREKTVRAPECSHREGYSMQTPPSGDDTRPATYREDPRWQQTQADFVADYTGTSPSLALVRRVRAIHAMFEIECEYEANDRLAATERTS